MTTKILKLESDDSDHLNFDMMDPLGDEDKLESAKKPTIQVQSKHLKSKSRGSSGKRSGLKRMKKTRSTTSFGKDAHYRGLNTQSRKRRVREEIESIKREREEQIPKSLVNKNSETFSQNLVKKQIETTIVYLSQNGYISFPSFTQALYLLQITKYVGRLETKEKRKSKPRRQEMDRIKSKEALEMQFAKQLWNVVNRWLFNYVDSVI